MAWSTARKNLARDRAARIGALQAPVDALVRDLGAAGVRVWGLMIEGLRLAAEASRELYGRTWVKVLLTVGFVGLLVGAVGRLEYIWR